MNWKSVALVVIALLHSANGCQFYPPGEYLRFVRVPEDLRVGQEVLQIDVFPRKNLSIQPLDKEEDPRYFTYRDLNRTTVALLLARSLEDLVDSDKPQNVLKFKVACDYDDEEDLVSSSLSVTVYVEDVNDHAPVFENAPYHIVVDELTPVGLTVFRGIRAVDKDKPNTPNSDVQYAIVAGNEKGKFGLDNSHQAFLVLKKALDYDTGDREFGLTITATDRGVPQRSTNATIRISVQDNDDLPPKFTKGVYRTKVTESHPLTTEKIHQLLEFDPPIYAYDQDLGIETPIRYDIIAGNERHLFYLDHVNGSLFLEREIDLDSERSLPANTFVLQIQSSQVDNPMKTGVARVEVEVIDLNDNLPEFEVDLYNISIVENLPNGFSVLQIIATDQDQGDNGEFIYQLEDKSQAFTLDSRTGWLTVRDQTVLDREKRSTIRMKVFAKEKVASVVTNQMGASSVAVEITLLDANDNNPTFIPNNIYEFNVSTTAQVGDPIGQIHAIDPDLGRNGLVFFAIQKAPNTSIPFMIDPRTGKMNITETPLLVGRHLLFVEASDQPINPSEKRVSLAVVTIDVRIPDDSRELPDFIGAPYEFWVGGNVDVGSSVGQIRITDDYTNKNLMYDLLHGYPNGVPFAVEERSGTITVVDALSKYDRKIYEFEAFVNDDVDISLVTNVTIHVVDIADKGIFMKGTGSSPMEFHVKENQGKVLIGTLTPPNATNNKPIKFIIANQRDVTDQISIASNGSLFTEKSLDREERDVYRLTIIAEGIAIGSGIYQAIVYVDDENDNAPKFEHDLYEGTIRENSKSGTEIELNNLVHVSDADTNENGEFIVSIFGNGSEMFRLDKNSGKIYFNGGLTPLDREQKDLYQLRLVAKDKGGLYSEVKLLIKIEDENDNPPVFVQMNAILNKGVEILDYDKTSSKISSPYIPVNGSNAAIYALSPTYKSQEKDSGKVSPVISLPEDISVGSIILKLIAEDKDLGDNAIIKYELISETYIPNEHAIDPFHVTQYFMVNPATGELIVARTLPPESEFRLNVTASDKSGLTDSIVARIFIKDINDHPPVFKKSWYNFDTEEAGFSRNILGKIEATDADFGKNANVSYALKSLDDEELPFSISEFEGILSVNGELDREKVDKYSFYVLARDNPLGGKALSSTVNVEVNVLDINDNAPVFYGYDDLVDVTDNENVQIMPVYYATAAENTPIGTPITRVFANDSDFAGNGNGLILFDIPYKTNTDNLFAIDSKEGIVTNIGKLDFETMENHNVTIVASDLGSPSLSSTALLIISVIDVQEDLTNMEHPVFAHRYYEVEVEENVPVPLKLVTLNVTEPYKNYRLRYSIVADKNSDVRRTFKIDPRNGSLYIIRSPDRESRALYEVRVRLDQYKVGRDMTVMVYPVTNEKLSDIGLNEVKVIVRVTDLNDNVPKFTITGRPIVAAIPSNANFGYQVIRLHAKDPDLGMNGEVRYQILGRADETSRRFTIDSVTGQVRAVNSFAKYAGKVFGFDVKATDRRGADDGKSSIANVLVYVLNEDKQLIMVMGSKPTEVEKSMDSITTALYNATGYDIRIRKIEPHVDRNQIDNSATDMYLYAVDPRLNVVVDMEQLQRVLQTKQSEIERRLDSHKVLGLVSGTPERNHARNQRVLLSTLEVGVVVLGCIVFLGALVTAVSVICVRQRRKRLLRKSYAHSQQMGYTLASTLGKHGLFPASFGDVHHYGDTLNSGPSHHVGYRHQHDVNCPRYARRKPHVRERSRSIGGVETSITSLHSSGHDSGIVDATAVHCQCGQSSSQSSAEESSNSYEDSLKSVPRKRIRDPSSTQVDPKSGQQHRDRKRSFSDEVVLERPSFVHKSATSHPHSHSHPHPHSHSHISTLTMPSAKRTSEKL